MSRGLTHSDLPMLRSLRDAYRKILRTADALKADLKDPGELLALATIVDDTQAKFEAVGRRLSQLEKQPRNARGAL